MASIVGTSNNDVITPSSVSAGVGGGVPAGAADIINGGGGADTAFGGNGNDYIYAVLGTPETINGGAGVATRGEPQ